MKYSIVMLTCNRAHLLGDSLHRVLQYQPQESEVIVVDNASTDGTSDILSSLPVTHVRLNKNYGVWARNLGFDLCRGEFIIQIDDDVMVADSAWVIKMESFFASDVIAVGQQGFFLSTTTWMGGDVAHTGEYCDILTGFLWMFRNKGYRYNRFWRDTANFWHEETFLQLQMKADGWRLRVCGAVATHASARGDKIDWNVHNSALDYVRRKWQPKEKELHLEGTGQ